MPTNANADGAAYGAAGAAVTDQGDQAEYAFKPAKKKRIQEKDIESIEQFVKKELGRRRESKFRKHAEDRWKEVDRQVRMEKMTKISQDGRTAPPDWHATIEIGEMSKALEIISSDVRRLIFPNDRTWFETHIKLDGGKNEDGTIKPPDDKQQTAVDNALRSMMVQQQRDIGLKDRHELSVKEALLHGSYVAEANCEQRMMVDDGYKLNASMVPVWRPHSMWNCYPDPSPSIVVGDLFYQGSMIIVHYMPRYKLEQMTGDGWMAKRYKKVPKGHSDDGGASYGGAQERNDIDQDEIEMITFYGDINVERSDDDLFFPNSKACFANGILVYFSPVELGYLPIIYRGYEKQDVRDPYFASPLMKLSPIQKTASVSLNKYLDALALKIEPPLIYDGNDAAFVRDGGPRIEPRANIATKGSGKVTALETGDPQAALAGFSQAMQIIQQGLGVDAVRSGTTAPSGRTAFEINKVSQSAEIRTLDFIDKLEPGLESYLYMQHDLNKKYLKTYSYYNDDLNAPDYLTASKAELPEYVKFNVTGSKSTLGEEQRISRTSEVTAFLLGNPLTAEKVNIDEVSKTMYQDAGIQNPARLLNIEMGQDPQAKKLIDAAKQKIQETQQMAQQAVQQAGDQIKELEQKLQDSTMKLQALQADKSIETQKLQLESAKMQSETQLKQQEFGLKQGQANQVTEGENLDRTMFVEAMTPLVEAIQQAAMMMQLAAEKSSAPRQINIVEEQGRIIGAVSQTVATTVQ